MAKYDWNTFRNFVAFLAGKLAPGTRRPHHNSELSLCYHDAFLPWGHYHNNIVLFYHNSPITRSHFMDPTDRAINHSGETDEANCSWLHPVWPPRKRSDQDSTFCVVSRASTELIFCIHRDFDVRNNVYKPHRLVCECCREISVWKSRMMKPSVLRE